MALAMEYLVRRKCSLKEFSAFLQIELLFLMVLCGKTEQFFNSISQLGNSVSAHCKNFQILDIPFYLHGIKN